MPRAYRNAKPNEAVSASAPKDEVKREFARRLQAAMTDRDMNQSDLARKASINRDNISNYVRGKTLPTNVFLKAVANALGVEAGWLLPMAAMPSVDREAPPLSMTSGPDGTVWLRINQAVDMATALEIMQILQKGKDK